LPIAIFPVGTSEHHLSLIAGTAIAFGTREHEIPWRAVRIGRTLGLVVKVDPLRISATTMLLPYYMITFDSGGADVFLAPEALEKNHGLAHELTYPELTICVGAVYYHRLVGTSRPVVEIHNLTIRTCI
jgi:hypothetical protein